MMALRISKAFWLAALVWLTLAIGVAGAVEPDEMLADPVLEARAAALDRVIRCVQCQSEPISSSNADWARDARILLRGLLLEGYSDVAIMDFFVERYGERVLMTPRRDGANLFLWIAGPLMVLLSLVTLVLYVRQSKPVGSEELTAREERRLRELLGDATENTPANTPAPTGAEDEI